MFKITQYYFTRIQIWKGLNAYLFNPALSELFIYKKLGKSQIIFWHIVFIPLMVKCKACGKGFFSEFQMIDTSFLHKPVLAQNIMQDYPVCGKSATYTKEDHFFQ